MDTIEIKASSVEKAIEQGLAELDIPREKADIEIVQEGGLFSKAIVRITGKITPSEKVINFLNGLFEKMSIRCYAECEEVENGINVEITGSDSGVIIGYRGEVLDAIQYLSLIIANKNEKDFVRVSLNAENYREKRQETLENLAKRLAEKAYKTGRKVTLEPMNPFERRIIHTALQDSEYAVTESEGEEPNRYVTILPKKRSTAEREVDFSVKKSGPPKVKSYGYSKRRF